jgi:opacity protein-like surface antigen
MMGETMKRWGKICGLAALVLLLALPTVAQAAMYVEALLGGSTASNPAVQTPAVIGGGRVGTWFVKEGALGLKYPNWMKYFGFYTDITINGIGVDRQPYQGASGYVATWAFMFAGRCGFIKDDEVPFGRIQPYVGIGPAVVNVAFNVSGNENSAFTPGLVMDAGVRYMANRQFSVDLFFRYRYAQPNLTYNFFSGMAGIAYHF